MSYGSGAFAYLEKPAMTKLLASLDAHKTTHMTINSMLRTVAQQYLLYRWGAAGCCGINVVAKPGNSNHETGLAMDIQESSTWRSSLSGQGFKWFGSSDAMHYDFTGSGAVNYKGLDIKAFQRLWNANNPNDKISVDGGWGPQTEARMKKAPAEGFASGPTCGSSAMLELEGGAMDGKKTPADSLSERDLKAPRISRRDTRGLSFTSAHTPASLHQSAPRSRRAPRNGPCLRRCGSGGDRCCRAGMSCRRSRPGPWAAGLRSQGPW